MLPGDIGDDHRKIEKQSKLRGRIEEAKYFLTKQSGAVAACK